VAALAGIAFRADGRTVFPVLWAAAASHSMADALVSKLAPGAELFWPFYSRRYSAGLFDYFDFSIRVRGPLEFLVFIVKLSVIEALIFIPIFLVIRLIANRMTSQKAPEAAMEQQKIG
jgi:hypothetical protein